MANQPDNSVHLQAFQASLDKLNTINNIIAQNNQNRDRFRGFVLDKLQVIRDKIQQLVGKISDIRKQLDALEGQVNSNSGDIQSKTAEITALQNQIQQLTDQSNQLTAQLTEANRLTGEKQTQIDQHEAQIRDLTAQISSLNAQLTNLTNERNTLQQELANKGDVQAQNASEIQRLTDANAAEIQRLTNENADNLQKQEQANQAQMQDLQQQIAQRDAEISRLQQEQQANAQTMQDLQQQIAQKDAEITRLQQEQQANAQTIQDLQQQIAQKDAEISGHQNNANSAQAQQQQHATDIASANNQITQLQQQINGLQAQNNDLIERIKAATIAITQATDYLGQLADPSFYQQSEVSVNQIVGEIEALLEQISTSIQRGPVANPPAGGPGGPGGPGALPPKIQNHSNPKQRSIVITINGYQTSVGDLLQNLRRKSSQIRTDPLNNKYIKAYNDIDWNLASNPPDVETMVKSVLGQYGVFVTNTGVLKGGNTRKHKKYLHKQRNKSKKIQRGGFLYGKNKTTNSVSTQPTASLSNSINSNYSKKQNTLKKGKKNRARGVSKRSKR